MLTCLAWAGGPRDGVPELTVTQGWRNVTRSVVNRRDLDWHVAGRLCLAAVPAAIAGSVAFAAVPTGLLSRLLSVFLLGCVAYRWRRPGQRRGALSPGSFISGRSSASSQRYSAASDRSSPRSS